MLKIPKIDVGKTDKQTGEHLIFISISLGNNSKNTIEAVMLILKLLFVFLSTKGNTKKILLYSLLFLAVASSAIGSLIKSYYFVNDARACAIRKIPSIPVTK